MRIFGDVLGGHTKCPSFDSLACAIGDTASAIDLLCPWQLFVSTFSATCSCHVGKEIMIFYWFQEKHMNSPRHNASASQHISTTNSQQQETHDTHSNKQQHRHHHNNHQQPTTTNNKCTVGRTATTPATATAATTAATGNTTQQQQQLFHQAASQNTPSPASMPAPAQRKSQAAATTAATKKNVTWHQAAWKPRLRFRNHPPSCPEPQNARASRQNRGGPSTTSILRAKIFSVVWVSYAFSVCCFLSVFFGVHCSSQEQESE